MKETLHLKPFSSKSLPKEALLAFHKNHGLVVRSYGYYQWDFHRPVRFIHFEREGAYTVDEFRDYINIYSLDPKERLEAAIKHLIINPIKRELERRCLLQRSQLIPLQKSEIDEIFLFGSNEHLHQ